MKFKEFSLSFFLIFCTAVFLFAQDKKPPADDYSEQLRIERENAANSKNAEQLLAARTTVIFPDLNLFLPNENDSWAVSITANGGIFGGSRILVAVNSDGNFLCASKSAEIKNQFVDETVFAEIARLAKNEFPRLKLENDNQKTHAPVSYCSDCAYETFNIAVRRNKTVELFQFNLRELADSKSRLKRIYERISNFSECR